MIEEKDILNYLDGNSTPELRARVETWISQSPTNEEEFEFTKMMWQESSAAKEYVKFDVAKEWEIFETNYVRKKASNRETEVVTLEKGSWRASLSTAASIAVLIAATWWLWPQPEYINIVEAASDIEVELDDGSVASIKQGATLRTKRLYKYETERNVNIKGEVIFDVAKDVNKPFIVKTEESAVEVLGTVFSVKTEGIESEVSNRKGLVKFFVIEDPAQFVTIEEGQVFRYDGYGFVDLNEPEPTPSPPPAPAPDPIPQIGDIIKYLRANYRGRVSFQSGAYEHASKDLDIDYEGKSVREIIRLMQEKAFVIYLNKGCPSCIDFVEIIPKRR